MTPPILNPSPPFPTSLLEFQARFPNEDACTAYLLQLRYPQGYTCPKCGSTRAWPVRSEPGVFICERNHKVSLTSGTVMHRSKQPICTWFHAVWLMVTMTPGISALQFQRQLGLSRYETAFNLLHKLRAAMGEDEVTPLEGEIEQDEIYFGGPEEGHPGRGAKEKVLVAVAVEVQPYTHAGKKLKKAGRARLQIIPNAKGGDAYPLDSKGYRTGRNDPFRRSWWV